MRRIGIRVNKFMHMQQPKAITCYRVFKVKERGEGGSFEFLKMFKALIFLLLCCVESVKLIGEGKYNLNDVKEIKVTDSYLGMDMKYRGCQNEEPFEECTTRHYIDTTLLKCGCLALSLPTSKNVSKNVSIFSFFKILFLGSCMYCEGVKMCSKY